MDKPEFLRQAPKYYALAVIAYIDMYERAASEVDLRQHYHEVMNDDPDGYYYLSRSDIFAVAARWLRDRGLIEIVEDPFAPLIILPSSSFRDELEKLSSDRGFPLYNYLLVRKSEAWLRSALHQIENEYRKLRIRPEDFDDLDREWEPLPIEHDDPTLKRTIEILGTR